MTVRLFDAQSVRAPADARFSARVVAVDGGRVALDRTLFYPTGGGQPCDRGTLGGVAVVDVVEQGDVIWHVLEGASLVEGQEVAGELDLARRRDHAEQHSGQHLLTAVLLRDHGIKTLSFHLGEQTSTIDLALERLDDALLARVEAAVNAVVRACLPVSARVHAPGDAARAAAATLRDPPEPKALSSPRGLRVVQIGADDAAVDRDACCGTHVGSTGELGAVLLLGAARGKKGQTRLEFVAGARAIATARARLTALAEAGAALTCGVGDVPARAAQLLQDAKALRKELDATRARLAEHEGRALAAAGPLVARLIDASEGDVGWARELARAAAKARPDARVALVHRAAELTLVVARGEATGLDAGAVVKALMARFGGRGGGAPAQAQGALADPARAAELLAAATAAVS
jgi:alanyl-tRNA synthetase